MRPKLLLSLIYLFISVLGFGQELAHRLNTNDTFNPAVYNVSWQTPSNHAKGSMPVGNGDIGANVWVEPGGDLNVLISKTDAFDEFNRLLKLGVLHIRTKPALIPNDNSFVQLLQLQNGCIHIKTSLAELKIWVDAHHPVLQVDIQSEKPVQVEAWMENWRKESRMLGVKEGNAAYGNRDADKRVNADSIVRHGVDYIASCHRNISSVWQENLKLTGLQPEIQKSSDPLLNRSFGVMVTAPGWQAVNDTTLISGVSLRKTSLKVFALTQLAPSCSDWLNKITKTKDQLTVYNDAQRFAAHKKWWQQFWNRSWIEVTGRDQFDTAAWKVSQVYALQRYVNACAGRGALPIKFNGSIFTVNEGYDADFRMWGGCYWWQNTRLPYWSMLYSGDYDLMKPLFQMYMKALPLRTAATQKYYGHTGAFFPETMNFWGNYNDVNYGLNRDSLEDGMTENTYIRRYWQSGIELTTMMLDYYEATQSKKFAKDTLLPFARKIIAFYNQHWQRNDSGVIVFSPAQSLETWHSAVNPIPEIAGLNYLLTRLMQLNLSPVDQKDWQHLFNSLPHIPVAQQNNETYLLPAQVYSKKSNIENCELYAVFPYRLFTALSKDKDWQTGLATWKRRNHKEDYGWQQNCFQAALLGLAGESKKMIIGRANRQAAGYRFPGFFGPNYDWTPDQDHPTSLMIALQRMIMQCENNKIVLMPAWPADWNVHFKLNAPSGTVISGFVQDQKLTQWDIYPLDRKKDVEIRNCQ
ncbi:DUF5703 domain-containing protein [Chitinophagaceae bacterium LB-8]|uniref:DUF5703 domain-containing protein n=1 Tax=Paraflavisolibacter caeni TaxID=2982496 RepID=A0A9X2Y2G9_9BACT|nr:DUF5703 domain-containing protein [Paraflavisolibacter caeni]MCU7552573.1 DUF5703 domain-containing protein [Paraflavisolibacter caeni]